MGHGTPPEQFTAFHYIFFSIFVCFAIYVAVSTVRSGKVYLGKGRKPAGTRPLPLWAGPPAAVVFALIAIWGSFGHALLPDLSREHGVDVLLIGALLFWLLLSAGGLHLVLSAQPLSSDEQPSPKFWDRMRERATAAIVTIILVAASALGLAALIPRALE